MIILDPGHRYLLHQLDGEDGPAEYLQFVKREGENYPGNVGTSPGTTTQEVIRALIDRMAYVNGQQPCRTNEMVTDDLRAALYRLEERAALKRGITRERFRHDMAGIGPVEKLGTCLRCGHIWFAHAENCRKE